MRRLRILVPPAFADDWELKPQVEQGVQTKITKRQDGAAEVIITVSSQARRLRELIVTLTGRLQPPTKGDWTLPPLRVAGAIAGDRYLVVFGSERPATSHRSRKKKPGNPAEIAGSQTSDSQASRSTEPEPALLWRPLPESARTVPIEAVPAWSRDAIAVSLEPKRARAFRSECETWTLTRTEPIDLTARPHVVLSDTQLWLQADGSYYGRTRLLMLGGSRELDIDLPIGISAVAVVVDDAAVPVEPSGRITIGLVPAKITHIVDLFWAHPGGLPTRWPRVSVQLPRAANVPTDRHVLAVVSTATARPLRPRFASFGKSERRAAALEKCQGLREYLEAELAVAETPPNRILWQELNDILLRLRRELRTATSDGGQSEIADQVAELVRWTESSRDRVVSRWKTKTEEAMPATAASPELPLVEPPLGDSCLLTHIDPHQRPTAISLWLIPQTVLTIGGAAAIFAVTLSILYGLARFRLLLRVSASVSLSLLVIGGIWWACLVASPVGFALVVASGMIAVIGRRVRLEKTVGRQASLG
ncbi:MAG: hypothetical protein GXP27_01510 [Planctomycetes bacterium]|nr:hypothetical protein [Planctomycetota bacterium]